MESLVVLIALLAVIAFLLGPIGFFLSLGAHSRLRDTERRLLALQRRLDEADRDRAALRSTLAAPAALPEAEAPKPPIPAEDAANQQAPEAAIAPQAPSPPVAAPQAPASSAPIAPVAAPVAAPVTAPQRSLEEALGTRWAVWIGGVALGLGGLLLVRYSIEQGWFGPGTRILLGLAFAATLIAGGEYLRRDRRVAQDEADRANSYIPGVLTAAGTVAAFGSVYAAHALYGFIGPAACFVALGAIGVATMLAAALHGPALAGLGLIGAMAAPVLVQTNVPNPWPVVIYVAAITAFAYGLARLRLWLWLALAAATGGFIWSILLFTGDTAFLQATLTHVVLQTTLATLLFAIVSGMGIADSQTQTDRFALIVPSCHALLGLIILNAGPFSGFFGVGWIVAASLIVASLAIGGLLAPTAAGLTLAAGVALAGSLMVWPAAATLPVFPSQAWLTSWPHPKDDRVFAAYAALATTLVVLASAKRLWDGRELPVTLAAIYAGAATLTPLAVLALSYMRLAHGETDFPFAAIAGGLALAFTAGANLFFNRDAVEPRPNIRIGLGALSAAALAALSQGLVFALDRGMLTLALALSALGAAVVDRRLGISALRWAVAGLGLVVAARLFYEPRIVGGDLGTVPIFNWLLAGYGVPALAFGLAAQLLHQRGTDRPVLIAQGLAILFAALLGFFEIRHALNGGDPFADTSSLIEQGLLTTLSFGFALVLARLDEAQTSSVLHGTARGFGFLSVALALIGLLAIENPLWTEEPLEGGLLLNALLLGYALPAIMALLLARTVRSHPPQWYAQAAAGVAIVLFFAYANLQLRRFFHDADEMAARQSTSDAEIYSYSALWLMLSILSLAIGLWRGSIVARMASAVLMLMTILKVFLYDLAGLSGASRAVSFIGLGLVLIGIGLVYQKLVFKTRRTEDTRPNGV